MNACKICRHKDLRAINSRLIKSTESLRLISQEYGVSESALYRHKQNHLPKSLSRGMERLNINNDIELANGKIEYDNMQISDSLDIVKSLNFIVTETKSIFDIAKEGKQNLLALKSLDSLRGTYTIFLTMLEKAESTYEARLELLRLENGEKAEEESKKYCEQLHILTVDELTVLERLVYKMKNQTTNIIVIEGIVQDWNGPLDFY